MIFLAIQEQNLNKRLLIFLALLLPLLTLVLQVLVLGVNDPIKYIYSFTGTVGIVLVFLTIALSLIKKWFNLMKYRRMIGLYAFFYAFLHFLVFFVLDAQFDLEFVLEESLDKPFVYLGMIAFFALLFMAITSSKKLFKKYNKYHISIYLVSVLVSIHFIMAQKSLSIEQWGYLTVILIIISIKFLQKRKLIKL